MYVVGISDLASGSIQVRLTSYLRCTEVFYRHGLFAVQHTNTKTHIPELAWPRVNITSCHSQKHWDWVCGVLLHSSSPLVVCGCAVAHSTLSTSFITPLSEQHNVFWACCLGMQHTSRPSQPLILPSFQAAV